MVNQEYYTLGTAPSVIRQLFAYGLEQAKVVGPENVYDYSCLLYTSDAADE